MEFDEGRFLRRDFLKGAAATAVSVGLAQRTLAELVKPEPAAAQSPAITVAWVAQQQAAQSNQRVWKGFQEWLQAKGYRWNVPLQDAKGDPGTLSNMITDAVSRRVDAIVCALGTLTAAQGALQTVKKAGTPFLSIDAGWYPPSICDIASNNYVMGAYMGQYLVQRLLGQGKMEANICVITANFHHGTRKRGKVLKQVLSENQNIKMLDERIIQYAGFYETTLNAVNDWLTRFGKRIDAIWTPWDEPGQAAATAIASRGMTADDIFVVAADGHPPAVEKMREKGWPMVATAAQSFELWGALAGYFVEQIVVKKRPTKEVVPVPLIDMPAPFIVKEVNMPPKGKLPWQTTDLYYVFENRARGRV